ncbi:energy-coupling factor transporter transmembrane protein EcfT [Hujiaoplasma nucleasis]|uniref:Energy-coupling factor transporter transmembrane protein EcfT n=1 Tax=Hujiaoplasma nucleasis TaxID=2725268 RepID=A0A7L6N5R2_9MOLU|nr:energy-coupling factor transporter transmembrane component T [Hujiaoplasma nucleasis]QLY40335.1 energy-coupling factor transporter transmembrane protein EcfT [Hujiaoplasma nucleasis]
MKSVVMGQYVPGDGFFHKVDPRTKIMAVLFLMIATFLFDDIYQIFVALLLTFSLLFIGKISILRVLKGLKPILVLLIFTFVFQILLNKEGSLVVDASLNISLLNILFIIVLFVIWRFLAKFKKFKFLLFLAFVVGSIYLLSNVSLANDYPLTSYRLTIYEKGIEMSVFVVFRLLIVITLSTLLTLTTKPTDLTQGLESLLRPFKKVGFNSDEFALIISISLRYIPTIFDEANKIMQAQASRGADFSEGKLKDKLKQVISLLIPMFIIAFIRSEELADAMGSRNFVPGKPRTRIHILEYSYRDIFVSIFTFLFFVTALLFRVNVLGY